MARSGKQAHNSSRGWSDFSGVGTSGGAGRETIDSNLTHRYRAHPASVPWEILMFWASAELEAAADAVAALAYCKASFV